MSADSLTTARLVLRRWRESDRAPFAALNADSRVMRFLGPPLPRAASDALAERIEAHFAEHGFGLWAVEAPGAVEFAGFLGLSLVRFEAPWLRAHATTPTSDPPRSDSALAEGSVAQRGQVDAKTPTSALPRSDPASAGLSVAQRGQVELSWRLAADCWGRGYATETARAALRFGFEALELADVVSFTTRENLASRAVMERLAMAHDSRDDFDHPALAPADALRPHVLYRLTRAAWRSTAR